ncbi:hypothetical protein SDC9_193193 [bioreactor metagenome]|uniref:Uncharacterized protein n=1 Tax=bioreactor metagenome TaxID=1076179 RepID=A0A645I2W1_9ZZZZ
MQSKHPTHLLESIVCSLRSMHWALHFKTHNWHLVHKLLFMAGLKIAALETKPRNAPTGHIVLQYNRPLIELNTPTRIKKESAKKKDAVVKCE